MMNNFPIMRRLRTNEPVNFRAFHGAEEFSTHAVQTASKAIVMSEPSLWYAQNVYEYLPKLNIGDTLRLTDLEIASIPSQPPFWMTWLEYYDSHVGEHMGGLVTYLGPDDDDSDEWSFSSFTITDGRLTAIPASRRVFFDKDGVLDDVRGRVLIPKGLTPDAEVNATRTMSAFYVTALTAFAFSHCKNVELVERLPKRHEQREATRKGEPILKYHEIVIDPGKTKQVAIGAGSATQDHPAKALHIARGHFATYTADKPLFGKYVGTFWRPAHVRGSADVGTVKSTYRVKAA